MFSLPEAWVWDFWFVDDGQKYHLFFLYASRALHDPQCSALPGVASATPSPTTSVDGNG